MYCWVRFWMLAIPVSGFFSIDAAAQIQTLAGNSDVQEILGLSDGQRASVSEISKRYLRIEGMTVLELTDGIPFASLSSRQQEEIIPQFAAKMVELDARALSELAEHLTPADIVRLKELRIQVLGPSGILMGTLQKDLELTDEDLDKLRESAAVFVREFSDNRLQEMAGMSPRKINRIYAAELIERLLEQMNQEQRQRYREMAGESVELPKIDGLR